MSSSPLVGMVKGRRAVDLHGRQRYAYTKGQSRGSEMEVEATEELQNLKKRREDAAGRRCKDADAAGGAAGGMPNPSRDTEFSIRVVSIEG